MNEPLWRRAGVLMPPPHLGEWARSHAALPIVDGDWLYFTARDAGGRAHVGRARLDLERLQLESPEATPVLAPGALGAFDDSGVTGSCIVRHGGELRLFYTGWMRGVTVPFYLATGVAVSTNDGASFERVSEAPLLDRTAVDPYLTASPWVTIEDGLWRMWYVSAAGWVRQADGTPQHRYHIRYAESADGWHWRREGRVCIDFADASEYAFGRPCVCRDSDGYRMWYCVRGARYQLGYAESRDGLHWTRRDHAAGLTAIDDAFEHGSIAYPIVVHRGQEAWLLYNGHDYGRTGIGVAQRASQP